MTTIRSALNPLTHKAITPRQNFIAMGTWGGAAIGGTIASQTLIDSVKDDAGQVLPGKNGIAGIASAGAAMSIAAGAGAGFMPARFIRIPKDASPIRVAAAMLGQWTVGISGTSAGALGVIALSDVVRTKPKSQTNEGLS